MKDVFVILFLCYSIPFFAQGISGVVYDSVTNAPLEGASVYFEGTTRGGITDVNGRFVLNTGKQISSPLIVSYLGYTDAVLTASWTEPMEIHLMTAPESLGEVVITGVKPFTRKELMLAFKEQFLGNSKAAKRCKILNEDVIDLWYDVPGKRLMASSNQPIIVENNFLGYEVRFRIVDFSILYYNMSVSPFDRIQTTYVGTTFFKDKQQDVKSYEKRRQKVYKTSALRLMRSIALEDWKNKDFTYYFRGHRTHPADLFSVTDSLDGKKVKLTNRIVIVDDNKRQSEIIPVTPYFMVDGFGNFYPPSSLSFSGQMGDQRIADLLPLDYDLEYIDE